MSVQLDTLERQAQSCQACALGATRTTLVWGSGNPSAEIMFIGEAPGRKEDEGGLPFIGAAGKHLDEFLDVAGFKRDDIYIANVLKCRPPNNRDPQPGEIEACQHWLIDQIHLIGPRIIVTLGAFSTRWVLGKDTVISAVQGKVFQHDNYFILPCYHPAAIIYDNSKSDAFYQVARNIAQL
ncbi:MAG: uracil-DNA glycosylase [Coriobacteriia bacterium]|nr:uracil-DNA glycosylase [Coriobacteriia bacterium]